MDRRLAELWESEAWNDVSRASGFGLLGHCVAAIVVLSIGIALRPFGGARALTNTPIWAVFAVSALSAVGGGLILSSRRLSARSLLVAIAPTLALLVAGKLLLFALQFTRLIVVALVLGPATLVLALVHFPTAIGAGRGERDAARFLWSGAVGVALVLAVLLGFAAYSARMLHGGEALQLLAFVLTVPTFALSVALGLAFSGSPPVLREREHVQPAVRRPTIAPVPPTAPAPVHLPPPVAPSTPAPSTVPPGTRPAPARRQRAAFGWLADACVGCAWGLPLAILTPVGALLDSNLASWSGTLLPLLFIPTAALVAVLVLTRPPLSAPEVLLTLAWWVAAAALASALLALGTVAWPVFGLLSGLATVALPAAAAGVVAFRLHLAPQPAARHAATVAWMCVTGVAACAFLGVLAYARVKAPTDWNLGALSIAFFAQVALAASGVVAGAALHMGTRRRRVCTPDRG